MSTGILETMTIEEVRAFRPEVVVMGLGSVEPHGPVLPYCTDLVQCDEIVRTATQLANDQGARALMYPTLPIGNNVNFKAFPFACRIGVRTLMQVILDIIAALEDDGIRKIVFFNGHGGNTQALRAALRTHADERPVGQGAFVCESDFPPQALEVSPLIEHPSPHGGEMEVSFMLHLRDDLVRRDKFADFPLGELSVEALDEPGRFFVRPWHLYVPASAGGDVRKATAEKGRRLFEITAEHLAKLLVQLSNEPWSSTFPYKK